MDNSLIDNEFQKLQSEANGIGEKIQNLADKLKALQSSGNQDTRELLLDLKDIALSVQSEQNQMFSFLQTLHQSAPQNQYQNNNQQPQQQGRGIFGSLLGSGFLQAIEMGAGFGIGDDLINSIF